MAWEVRFFVENGGPARRRAKGPARSEPNPTH